MNSAAYISFENTIGVNFNDKHKKYNNNVEVAFNRKGDSGSFNREEIYKDNKTPESAVNTLIAAFQGKIVDGFSEETYQLKF